jgi:hypothetical protein
MRDNSPESEGFKNNSRYNDYYCRLFVTVPCMVVI